MNNNAFAFPLKTRILIGTAAAIACLVMPFLSRIPRGAAWVAQYLPDQGHVISGILFFGAFALIPAVVVFLAGLVSKPPLCLPVAFSTALALLFLGFMHYRNDLTADAQAALSLIFIPILAGGVGLIGGLAGFGVQTFLRNQK